MSFLNDYESLQVQTLTLSGFYIDNAAAANTSGVEFEIDFQPLSSLLLSAGYAYLNTKFTQGNWKNNELAFSPKNTVSASTHYQQETISGKLDWSLSYSWRDDFYFEADNQFLENAYGLWDFGVFFSPNTDRWNMGLRVSNLSDKEYTTSRSDLGTGLGLQIIRGMPRLIRIEANLFF